MDLVLRARQEAARDETEKIKKKREKMDFFFARSAL
jgi:hypothetical protein